MDAWMLPSFPGSNCNFVFVDVTMTPAIASSRHIHILSNSNFAIVFEDTIMDLQQ
jgi:hypothetical protein